MPQWLANEHCTYCTLILILCSVLYIKLYVPIPFLSSSYSCTITLCLHLLQDSGYNFSWFNIKSMHLNLFLPLVPRRKSFLPYALLMSFSKKTKRSHQNMTSFWQNLPMCQIRFLPKIIFSKRTLITTKWLSHWSPFNLFPSMMPHFKPFFS